MFRFLSAARNPSVCIYESCALSAKCDKVFRSLSLRTDNSFPTSPLSVAKATTEMPLNGLGVNALSTNAVRLCERKDHVVASFHDEKANAVEEGEQKKVTEEPAVLKADGGTTQHQADVGTQQVAAKPTEVMADTAKSSKESLLDLLGAMKVEVTNKRKLKNLRTKQSFESSARQKSETAHMESTISMFQKAAEASSQSETLDPALVAAASAAAASLPNQRRAESELLKQLRQRKALTEAQKQGDMSNLGVIIADMKVGKNSSRQNGGAANQIQFDDDGSGYRYDKGITGELAGVRRRRNLLSGKRLNIFAPTPEEDGDESAVAMIKNEVDNTGVILPAKPTLWDIDFVSHLSQSTNQMPRNGFEEMIQWTKEGKLWQYPINNEDGLEEEASVPFHEHIFLEKHLEEGFPRQGPVRHFMELVVAGLSRNPHLTVQQKKEHISWFRDYFHQKEDVLNDADVN